MRYPLTLLIFSLLILGSCRSPALEREDIPLMWGIRYEGEEAANWLKRNIQTEDRGREWMVEIPVVADDSMRPTIPDLPLKDLQNGLEDDQLTFNLAFTTSFEKELFPEGKFSDTTEWFKSLTHSIQECLGSFNKEPERVIVGNDWKVTESAQGHWRQVFTDLRTSYKGKLGYGWHGDRTSVPSWIDACDFFALEYPPVADPNPKPYCIQNNPRMAGVADSLGLPLFIYRANVMGNYKTIGLKNRLRFWPEEIPVSGLVANSLYPKLPLLDSSSYFGVMQDQEFINYWKSYQNIQ